MPSELDPMLRMPAVKLATGLSRATIYRYIKEELFPQPRRLGKAAVGWPKSVVDAWLASRPTGQA